MSAATAPNTLDVWLSYAKLGIPIVPEHTPDPSTATGCDCLKDNCAKPGKHPRTLKGSDDATTDAAKIRRWYQMFPQANVGTSLGMAGLVIIGPDSPEWHEEFKRRGLKDGPVARSGGGEGHLHYFRRLPPGVPATRICKSGEYDILALGNAILAPSLHASGRRYEWIVPITSLDDIPYLEEWACDELRAAGAKRERAAITRGDDDGPPIELDDFALRVYLGELPKFTKEGQVERSGTLLKIARVLYDAGATRRLIVQELAEIDAARYQKYTHRPDANERYHGIIDELERRGRNDRRGPSVAFDDEPTTTGTDGGSMCDGNCPTSQALREQLHKYKLTDQIRQGKTVSAGETEVLRYYNTEAATALSQGKTEVPVWGEKTEAKTGQSPATATRLHKTYWKLQADPKIGPTLPWTLRKDTDAEGHDHYRVVVRVPDDPSERTEVGMLAKLARLRRPDDRAQHGGARDACPKCQSPMTRTTTDVCQNTTCGHVVTHKSKTVGRTADSKAFHDETGPDTSPFNSETWAVEVQAPTPFHDETTSTFKNSEQDEIGPKVAPRELTPAPVYHPDEYALAAGPRRYIGEAPPPDPAPPPELPPPAPSSHHAWWTRPQYTTVGTP